MNLQQRIDDFLVELANLDDDWDEHQSALTDFVEMELLDQRAMCANAVREADESATGLCMTTGYRACINAVEKK